MTIHIQYYYNKFTGDSHREDFDLIKNRIILLRIYQKLLISLCF